MTAPVYDAAAVRALRRRLGLTQEQFAHRIGVTVATVSHWEAGHHTPRGLARRALAQAARRQA